jgi:hypothetical protein
MRSIRTVCVYSMFHLTAIVLMAVDPAGAAGVTRDAPPEQQWIGVWTGVDDEMDGRFHNRSLVDFQIGAAPTGLEFQDLDRMRGASLPVKMMVQGEQFST